MVGAVGRGDALFSLVGPAGERGLAEDVRGCNPMRVHLRMGWFVFVIKGEEGSTKKGWRGRSY